jgi:hypothetical protein
MAYEFTTIGGIIAISQKMDSDCRILMTFYQKENRCTQQITQPTQVIITSFQSQTSTKAHVKKLAYKQLTLMLVA